MENIGEYMQISVKNRVILEIAISVILLCFYFIFNVFLESLIEQTFAIAMNQTLFPRAITITVVIMCFLLVFDSIKCYYDYKNGKQSTTIDEYVECSEERIPVGRIILYLIILFGYLAALNYIGFMYSTPIVMLLIATLLGMKKFFLGAIGSILFTIALYYASLYGLQILLPTGVLFQ